MSFPLAVSLIVGAIIAVVVWMGSFFVDYDLARQMLIPVIAGGIMYLIVDFKETFDET